jgi:aspartate racemase
MLRSAEKLARAGADFLICPDNTIHQVFDLVEHRSPRPWLHIGREVAKEAQRRQFVRLGVLGTRYLMEGPVYRDVLKSAHIESRTPPAEQRERINRVIFDELVNGQILSRSQAYFVEVPDAEGRGLRRGRAWLYRNPIADQSGDIAAAHARLYEVAGASSGAQGC